MTDQKEIKIETDDLDEFVSGAVSEEKEIKELFSKKDIEVKTELTSEQINIITKLRFIIKRYDLEDYNELLSDFMELRVSKDRKGRLEFVDALKSKVNEYLNKMTNLQGFENGRTR